MTPANPDNNKPFIYRIADALGITHLVVAVQHSHLMSEVTGLVSALAGKSDADHTHKLLQYNPSSSPDGFAGFTASGHGNFTIGVQESKSISLMFGAYTKANITNTNVDNLARVLQSPDSTPTENSDKLVTSGGVKAALDAKYSINQVDENDEQEAHLSAIAEDDDIYFDFRLKNGNTQKEVLLPISNMDNFARAISNPDTTPTSNSDKLVTSGGVYEALASKADDVNVRYNEFEKSDAEEVIDLDEVFGDDHMVSHFILQNLTNASCNISDFFTAANANILDNGETVPQYSFAIVKVVMYDNDSTTSYFVVVDGIYEM